MFKPPRTTWERGGVSSPGNAGNAEAQEAPRVQPPALGPTACKLSWDFKSDSEASPFPTSHVPARKTRSFAFLKTTGMCSLQVKGKGINLAQGGGWAVRS